MSRLDDVVHEGRGEKYIRSTFLLYVCSKCAAVVYTRISCTALFLHNFQIQFEIYYSRCEIHLPPALHVQHAYRLSTPRRPLHPRP